MEKILNELINEGQEVLKTHRKQYSYLLDKYMDNVDKDKYEKWIAKIKVFINNNKNYENVLKINSVYKYNITKTLINKLEGIKETLNIEKQIDEIESINVKIHPDIYKHIKKYLNTDDFFHAVEEAYKVVREKLKELTGNERATDAFNDNNMKQIFKYESKDAVEKDFLNGIKFSNMAIQNFRNVNFHTLAKDLDKNLAYHYITLASLAYELINNNS